MADDIPRKMETSAASAAVIVDVVDWDLGHAKLIEDSLAAGGIAVAVAGNSLVDVVIVDLGIEHRFHAGFESELGVVNFAAGFDKFSHAYAKDVAWLIALDDHLGG
jgi:hypothetical protein